MRVGMGFDAHRFVAGRRLVLGGVTIDHDLGLEGHSDADVLTHAIMDALLGATALGDIGQHFPSTDAAYVGVSSVGLLTEVVLLLKGRGYRVINIDCVLSLEAPKITPHVLDMRKTLAEALHVTYDAVGVKATTTEGLGFTGRGEGVAAWAVALVSGGRPS